jgi:hypothetical protein
LDSPADPIASRANNTYEKVYSRKTVNPCYCLLEELSKNLTKFFKSSDFRKMQIGDFTRAQTISLNEMVSEACGEHRWFQLCGKLKFTALTSDGLPFGGLAWAEHTQIKGRRLQTAPSRPAAPTTLISGNNVIINWGAPFDGNSAITNYSVSIQRLNGYTYYTGCTGTATSCTVPISTLQAAPYNLANGSSVYA